MRKEKSDNETHGALPLSGDDCKRAMQKLLSLGRTSAQVARVMGIPVKWVDVICGIEQHDLQTAREARCWLLGRNKAHDDSVAQSAQELGSGRN